jgi:hypothetical protein
LQFHCVHCRRRRRWNRPRGTCWRSSWLHSTLVVAGRMTVSSPGESHPQALSEPYVSLSTHTAPGVQPPEPPSDLALIRGSSPQVGLIRTSAEPPAPLRSSPITGPSTLLRTLLPLCPASVLWHLRFPPLALLPSHRDDRFSCSSSKPDPRSCRLHAGRQWGTKQAHRWEPPPHPRARTQPWFRRRLGHLDTSSAVHLRSTPRISPDAVLCRVFSSDAHHQDSLPQQLVAV